MPFTTRLLVTPAADRTWRLAESLVYQGQRDQWVIPAGYVTDYASVPPVAAWLIPTYGRWTRAAIVHDYLITHELPAGRISSVDLDGVFRRILRELGVSTPRRWLMWAGVRWGALFGGRARGWLPTALPVLAISLAALPGLLVGGVGVLVGSTPLFLAEWFSPSQPSPPEPGPARTADGDRPPSPDDPDRLRARAVALRAELDQQRDAVRRAAVADAERITGAPAHWDGDVLRYRDGTPVAMQHIADEMAIEAARREAHDPKGGA